jgi:hypothetical protein
MVDRLRAPAGLVCAVAILLAATSAGAQIGDQLASYMGENAEAYLEPLARAIGSDLNSGIFHSARVPETGFHLSVETPVMVVMFSDDDNTFGATVPEGFTALEGGTEFQAPTVVGPGSAVYVAGEDSTSFAFPGGMDLSSFALAAPQIRIGSLRGTEAVIRYLAIDAGDSDIGQASLLGFGVRHSLTQYMTSPAFDASASVMYHNFKLGDDLIKATALSVGVQAGKTFGAGWARLEPYAGLSYDTFQMDVSYETSEGEPVDLSFDSKSTAHLTLGLSAALSAVSLYGEYNIADQSGFAFGLSIGA